MSLVNVTGSGSRVADDWARTTDAGTPALMAISPRAVAQRERLLLHMRQS